MLARKTYTFETRSIGDTLCQTIYGCTHRGLYNFAHLTATSLHNRLHVRQSLLSLRLNTALNLTKQNEE